MDKVNMERIVLARESRGLNQAELAARIGYTPNSWSRIERGEGLVSAERLDRIVEVTDYPHAFFYQPGSIAPQCATIRRREKVAQPVLDYVTAQVNILRLLVEDLSTALGLIGPALPLMTITGDFTPAMAAQKLRRAWGIPEAPLLDLTYYVEAHGIPVWVFPFETERVDSRMVLTANQYPLICVNSSHTGDRQRFSLAYQLGQVLLHTFCSVETERNTKHEANLFAAELLMPEKELRLAFEKGVNLPRLMELKRKWRVSMIALLYRADDLGYLSEEQKHDLVHQFNKLGIRRREPVEVDIPPEHPKLLKDWMETLSVKEGLDTIALADRLHFSEREFVRRFRRG
jgi:Zn-dependent peptidase ImmA (M78 family)/DNA-binding XRE family transcriptional regulator